jgi:DNA-binding NtrC family response regulator
MRIGMMPVSRLHIMTLDGDRRAHEVAVALAGPPGVVVAAGGERPRVDVALVDISVQGAAPVVALRELDAALPIVALVPRLDARRALEGIRAGATEIAEIGAPVAELSRIIGRAVERAQRGLQEAPAAELASSPLVGASPATSVIRDQVRRVGSVDAPTVLITGESGVGKDVIANALHAAGPRRDRAFMAIDCAAIPETLLESHLFGHERGAFTDARQLKRGLFELAGAGTLFLDEIGELPLGTQAKLLRALESRRFRRVGGERDLPLDAAIIAATNRDLLSEARDGSFRADLYYRLNVVRIHVPPLRERPQDVAPLVAHFITRFNERLGRRYVGPDAFALRVMQEYDWPGNVRELRNAVERAMILNPDDTTIRVCDLPPEILEPLAVDAPPMPAPTPGPETGTPAFGAAEPHAGPTPGPLHELEHHAITAALHETGGNQSRAAELLGISRFALRSRLRRLGLEHLAHGRRGRPRSSATRS